MEDGTAGGSLPTKETQEFRPFVRRLPEFKFWYAATRAVTIAFLCTWFQIFDIPVFWPVLVVYWLILFTLTSKSKTFFYLKDERLTCVSYSEAADPAHDQVSIRPVHGRKEEVQEPWAVIA